MPLVKSYFFDQAILRDTVLVDGVECLRPLALGIHKTIFARLRDQLDTVDCTGTVLTDLIKAAMKPHVSRRKYLAGLLKFQHRFDLDGNDAGAISDKHKARAEKSWQKINKKAMLSLLKRCIEQAHREQAPEFDVSTYHLAVDVVSDYKGMLIALPPSAWSSWSEASPGRMVDYLLHLARFVSPRSVATSKRGPKKPKPKGYVEAAAVRKHMSTARVLRCAKDGTP